MQRTRSTPGRRWDIRRRLAVIWRLLWPIVRQVLGWTCIVVGLLGLVLPLLQGIPLLVIGIALVGRRHPLIRWTSVHFKLLLRRWAALQTPIVGPLGRLALRAQQNVSRQRRRLHWWYVERKRLRAQQRAALVKEETQES